MWNVFKLSLIVFVAQVAFAQAPTEKQDQYNRFKTKIINGGFENGTSNWTASGGSFTVSTTGGDFRSGLRGGVFDASAASQTLTSSANTLSPGNNQVSCWFKTTATDYKFGIYDGTNVIVEQTIPATTVFQKMVLNYAMSASGQMRARITSQSNAAALYIDDCFAGEADNVATGSFASDYQSYTPGTNVTTNTTTSGKWRRVGDSLELEIGIDWSGAPSAFSQMQLDIPTGLTIDSNKILSTTSQKEPLCVGSIFDPAGGTTRYIVEGTYLDADSIRLRYAATTGSIVYQNADISNTTPFSIGNGSYVRLKCGGIPITGWGSQSVFDPNIAPAYWSGYHAADCTWTSSTSTYGDFASGDATCTFTEVVNNNFGTVSSYQISGNNGPGLVFTPTRSGVYEVCADIMSYGPASSGTRQGFHLYDGTNVIAATEFQTQSASQNVESHHICGYVNASSIASKTYRLQAISASGTITVGPTTSGALAEIYWTIKQLSAVATAPLLVGNLTSNANRSERMDSASVVGTAGTISSQSGSWITTGRTSAGIYPITFASGYYSSAPRCVVSLTDNTNGFIRFLGTPSNTGGSVVITNVADSANVDRDYTVMCMGPK